MAEKVTEMRLKVDLQCPCSHKKVKKILCKFPQIRDQVYDEKNNMVTIIVVCCNPEKIRDKLCCKGGKVIQSIEIVEPPPRPPPPPPPPPSPPQPVVLISMQALQQIGFCAQCYGGYPGGPCCHGCVRPVPQPCFVSRSDQYFSDGNPSVCSIM